MLIHIGVIPGFLSKGPSVHPGRASKKRNFHSSYLSKASLPSASALQRFWQCSTNYPVEILRQPSASRFNEPTILRIKVSSIFSEAYCPEKTLLVRAKANSEISLHRRDVSL